MAGTNSQSGQDTSARRNPAGKGGTVHGELLEQMVRDGAEVFETLYEVTLHEAHNFIRFYTWGDEGCCLLPGAVRATLLDTSPRSLALRPGDVLIFEERKSPLTGKEEDADPSHRHAVRLVEVSEVKDELLKALVLDVAWHAEDALPFPLWVSSFVQGGDGQKVWSDISVARGNVVLADHGQTVPRKHLVPPRVPSEGLYRPYLEHRNLTFMAPYDHEQARSTSAAEALVQKPGEALPALLLFEGSDEEGAQGGNSQGGQPDGSKDGAKWEPQRELLNSGRFKKEFVVEMETDGRAAIRFGDDVLGQSPPEETELKAAYRIGNGPAGNVGADTIVHVVSPPEGISGVYAYIADVYNPLPARGGRAPESSEQVRLFAPQAFRTQMRAVTEQDYAEIAQRHPEVQKAVARLRWTGSWHTAVVSVDRKEGRRVNATFQQELSRFIEAFRLAGHDLEITPPRFVALEVAFTVTVAPGHLRNTVKSALQALFGNTYLPDGRQGMFHPDRYTFGQPVYLSKLVAAAMQLPGVQSVDSEPAAAMQLPGVQSMDSEPAPSKPNLFRRMTRRDTGEWEAGVIAIDELEIARLDNDPNAPENGRIEFYMKGGM